MQNIILIGFMGCGKSTLGKRMANKFNFEFLDSDKEIEKNEHLTVSEIFEKHGENYFRDLEKNFLLSIQNKKNIVLSTGGGLPCFHENMNLLNALGTTFYIKLHPIELTKRILIAKTVRPLVKDKSKEELYIFVNDLLEKRATFYSKANHTLSGKEQNVKFIEDLLLF